MILFGAECSLKKTFEHFARYVWLEASFPATLNPLWRLSAQELMPGCRATRWDLILALLSQALLQRESR